MSVATEDLVRAFARDDDLVPGLADRAAQEVLRDAVSVDAEGLGLMHRIAEVIREIVLPDRNRMELGADASRHLTGFPFLVVIGPIEGQREGADRIGMMAGD